MADYVINCQANSLLEYTPRPRPNNPHMLSLFLPFFTVDFTKGEIETLIGDIKKTKAAGICLVSGFVDHIVGPHIITYEEVYAFRVQWKSEDLVMGAGIPGQIAKLEIPMLPEVGFGLPSIVLSGHITWTQPEDNEFSPNSEMPSPHFVFFDADTLRRLLADNCTSLRFRKTLIKSKTKSLSSYNAEKYQLLNLIVETVPTFKEKALLPHLGVVENQLTDEDAVAYDYGYPCPPKWDTSSMLRRSGNPTIFYGIIKRSQVIQIGNGITITMGSLVDALAKNNKAQELLKDWKLYAESKKLKVINSGKIVQLE
jgi:hypothetical protein